MEPSPVYGVVLKSGKTRLFGWGGPGYGEKLKRGTRTFSTWPSKEAAEADVRRASDENAALGCSTFRIMWRKPDGSYPRLKED